MRAVHKILLGALLASAAFTGVAQAEGTITGNIAVTTDYEFRGISQSNGNPAVQGGFDYVDGQFYAGTWLSSIAFSEGPELDVYAGVTPTLGPVALNLGVIGYFYPGAKDDAAEFDYYEAKATATVTPVTGLSLTGSLYYSPDYTGETGNALYSEIAASFAVSDKLSVSGAYGHQTIADLSDYNTWNLGATYTIDGGYSVDLRYMDTDINSSDAVAPLDSTLYDAAFVLTLKKTL